MFGWNGRKKGFGEVECNVCSLASKSSLTGLEAMIVTEEKCHEGSLVYGVEKRKRKSCDPVIGEADRDLEEEEFLEALTF